MRLCTLYEMRKLLEYLDENHLILLRDIVRRLREYGGNSERKSFFTDIVILKQFGMDITIETNVDYNANHRTFEFTEKELLADAIQYRKFITEKLSRKSIEKI